MTDEGEIHITTRAPRLPDDAEFAIYIDFKKSERNPQRVFQAAELMIRGLQKLDETLCETIDSSIKPLLVLEDIEAGSIKIWLKNILEETDDDALKTLDWKPQVGKYLIKAKYAYIRWVNQGDQRASLVHLSKDIQKIAAETDVKHFPDYKPPAAQDLIAATADIEKAKSYLLPGDSLSYLSREEGKIDFDLTVSWSPESLEQLITKETVKFPPAPMIFAVKKPDYLGNSKWEFRFGKKSISAKIEDENWLKRFQNREIDVRPGDTLRCLVSIEHSYGYDNELISEVYIIKEVREVLENQYKQDGLFDD